MKRRLVLGICLLLAGTGLGSDRPTSLWAVKSSLVGVGNYMILRQQQYQRSSTGFLVADGQHVVTNAQVGPQELDEGRCETVAVYMPTGGNQAERQPAQGAKRDRACDLRLLRFDGAPMRALRLGRSADVQDGALYALAGFPILTTLGLRPVTHRGIVSAINPIILPLASGKDITPENLPKRSPPFAATAYPGNSGSTCTRSRRAGWWA